MKQQKKIKYLKKTWIAKTLVPNDFLEYSYWPFSYYILKEDTQKKQIKEIKRNWNLPPKEKVQADEKIDGSLFNAFRLGCDVKTLTEYNEIKENKMLYNLLLGEIYSLAYKLTDVEKFFVPQKVISKDFAEGLAIKSKSMNVEPYSFMVDLSKEKPELFNPKRYDFNFFILGVGWERERREMEEATKEAENRLKKVRRGR